MNKISTKNRSSLSDRGNFLLPFKFILTLLFGALAIYVLALANYSIISSDSYYIGTITVTGKGEVELKPDIQKLSVNIATGTSTTDYSKPIITYLKSKGVPESDIRVAGKSLTIKLRGANMDNSKAISAGVEKISPKYINVSLASPEVDNLEIVKSRALEMALSNAKMNAIKVSRSLGADLGKVTSFYDNNQNGGGYPADSVAKNDPNKYSADITVSYQIR